MALAASNWIASKSLPGGGKKSSFSRVSIDGVECNGPFCVWSMYVSLWAQSPAERQTDIGPIIDECLPMIDDRRDSAQISHRYMYQHTHTHTHRQCSIISFIIYCKAETNPRLRREIMIRGCLCLQVSLYKINVRDHRKDASSSACLPLSSFCSVSLTVSIEHEKSFRCCLCKCLQSKKLYSK